MECPRLRNSADIIQIRQAYRRPQWNKYPRGVVEWAFIPLHCCSKFLSEMCKAILTISSLRRSHNCRGFRYTKMLRQFVTAGVWRLSDAVIGYPCTAPLLCSCRGIIRLCRSMSVWSYFHAPMNFLTSPHSPQHSYSCNIFIEYCIARGLLLSIFLEFSQQFFA